MPRLETEKQRVLWIDTLKGIGIFLVIVGHYSGPASPLHRYIYSFHMPLFFLASGFLGGVQPEETFGQFLKKRSHARLLPYIIFFLISYAFFIYGLAESIGMSIGEVVAVDHFRPYVIQPIIGLILVQKEWVTKIRNVTLWFLPCLLVVESVFFLLRQGMARMQRNVLLVPAVLVASVTAFVLKRGPFPWYLDDALVFLVFYGIGYAVRKDGYAERVPLPRGVSGRVAVIAGLAFLSLVATFYPVQYGEHSLLAYLLYVIRAIAGIALSIAVARLLIDYQPLRYFGRYSLVLLGTHMQMMIWAMAIINLTADLLTDKPFTVNDDIIAVLLALVTMIITIPFIEMLRLLNSVALMRLRAKES